MSRLDSMIRRLEAQRACLVAAIRRVERLPGPFLELGLGNGRTFDHIRKTAPQREVYVFERRPAAHPDCTPEPEFLIEGEFGITLGQAPLRIRSAAVLAHCDIGTGLKEFDQQLARAISADLDALLSVGAVILSDQPFEWPAWKSLVLPAGVDRLRYYMYSKIA